MKISQVGAEMFHADKWADVWWSFYCNLANTPYLRLFPPYYESEAASTTFQATNPAATSILRRLYTPNSAFRSRSTTITDSHKPTAFAETQSQATTATDTFILSVFLSFLFPYFKQEQISFVSLCAVSGMINGSGHNFNSWISSI